MLRSPFWVSTFIQQSARACVSGPGRTSPGSPLPRAEAVVVPPRAPPPTPEERAAGAAAAALAPSGAVSSPVNMQAASVRDGNSDATRMGVPFHMPAILTRRRKNAGTIASRSFHSREGLPVSPVSSELVKEFAPTGRLCAAINQGNSVLAQKGPNGEALGVTVELARELAKRLGVPIDLVIFDGAGKAFDALKSQLDIGFLAIEPVRAAE